MKTLTMLSLLSLLACGQPPSSMFEDTTAPVIVELGVVTQLRATLATWPSCTVEPAQLWQLTPRWCTHRFCGSACCNTCSWNLRSVTAAGVVVALGDPATLGLPPSGLECEAVAVTDYLATVLIDLGAHCVVR